MNPTTETPQTQTAPHQVGTVQTTTNYDQFTFLDANREVNERHVGAIRRSFENNGNFTQAQPILVNERMQIVDGQHRFVAARELDLPVFYTIVPGLGAREAQQMNLLHRAWTNQDYLHAYVQENKRPYILFQQLAEEYPTVSHTLLIIYIAGVEAHGIHKKFRTGELHLNLGIMEQTRRRLDRLVEAQELNEAFKFKPMAVALLRAMGSEGYRHRKMLEKIAQQNAEIRNYQQVQDNLRQLENVFNWHVTPANHVRFF